MSENVDGWKEEIEKLRAANEAFEKEIYNKDSIIYDLKERLGWSKEMCRDLTKALLNFSKKK